MATFSFCNGFFWCSRSWKSNLSFLQITSHLACSPSFEDFVYVSLRYLVFGGCLRLSVPCHPQNGLTSTAGANVFATLFKYCSFVFFRDLSYVCFSNTVQVSLGSEFWINVFLRDVVFSLCAGYLFLFLGFVGPVYLWNVRVLRATKPSMDSGTCLSTNEQIPIWNLYSLYFSLYPVGSRCQPLRPC